VQRAPAVDNNGMGDMLRSTQSGCAFLIERHLLHTGSARARETARQLGESLTQFVKVMPTDYARALTDMKSTRTPVAAE
jgi:glutamate synthase (NADPH/NADH) large chain